MYTLSLSLSLSHSLIHTHTHTHTHARTHARTHTHTHMHTHTHTHTHTRTHTHTHTGSDTSSITSFSSASHSLSSRGTLTASSTGVNATDGGRSGSRAYWKSFISGIQRVVLFTPFIETIDRIKAVGSYSRPKLEFSLALRAVGLSLVDNHNKRELAYIAITQFVVHSF